MEVQRSVFDIPMERDRWCVSERCQDRELLDTSLEEAEILLFREALPHRCSIFQRYYLTVLFQPGELPQSFPGGVRKKQVRMPLRDDGGQRPAADPEMTGISPACFLSGKQERAHSITFPGGSGRDLSPGFFREHRTAAGQHHVQAVRHLSLLPVRKLVPLEERLAAAPASPGGTFPKACRS